jgi:KDO2-lipid IV(A) lauroyltransferase
MENERETGSEAGAGPKRTRRKRRKSRPLVWLEYAMFRALVRAVRNLSDPRVETWSGRIGRLASRLLGSRTRVAMRNLRGVFPDRPEEELRRIADACWRHYARSIFDYFRADAAPADLARKFTFVGPRDAFFESIERGPVLILFSHFGNWEMATYLAHLIDRRITAVARRLDNPLIDRDLLKSRERSGLTIVDRRRAARELLRALERGDAVAMVVDQAVKPREGILVPFLGRPAWTTDAPARLSIRYGVPIWCLHVVALGDDLEVTIDGPIGKAEGASPETAIPAITREINDAITRRILERPALWLWMHDRWKGVPD